MSKLWIQLGKTGDLLNLLPLLWSDAQRGERPKLLVARQYAPLLEGVSYVQAIPFEGAVYEIGRAVEQAKAINGEWVCTQVNGPAAALAEFVYGPAGLEHARTTSFAKEQWRVAGRLGEWGEGYPLLFDRRDKEREQALLASVLPKKGKPFVLMHAEGVSSPFPYKELLLELLKHCGFTVIDLSAVRAERLYDLLGLFELAKALVAVDSSILHLAQACPSLPVLALANDQPSLWHGSPWRAAHEWYCRYSDFPLRAVSMLQALRGIKPLDLVTPRIVHVWQGAARTAPESGLWRLTPITPGMCARLGPAQEPKTLYLRDAIKLGLQRAGLGWLCLTRGDTQFRGAGVEKALTQAAACFAYRINVRGQSSQYAPVVDMFCARAEWWRLHLVKIPDLLLGQDYFWSETLRSIFQAQEAIDVTGVVSRESPAPKSRTGPSAAASYNQTLAADAMAQRAQSGRYPPIERQLPTVILDTTPLPPRAYNPSIGSFEGRACLTYRYHFAGDTRTRLGLATLGQDYRLENPRDLPLSGVSLEDARLFRFHGETWLSWVESDWLGQPDPHCVVKYAQLEHGPKVGRVYQVAVGSNDGRHLEKNWCFFEQDENLFCVYRAEPDYTVLQVQGATIVNEYKSPALRWPYGEIRGGCVVAHGEHWLRFFHSHTEGGIGQSEVRYFMGACLMERKLPFRVLACSRKPILYGAELPNCGAYPYKGGVVFPGGAIKMKDGGWLVAVGINDSACGLVTVTPDNLNL